MIAEGGINMQPHMRHSDQSSFNGEDDDAPIVDDGTVHHHHHHHHNVLASTSSSNSAASSNRRKQFKPARVGSIGGGDSLSGGTPPPTTVHQNAAVQPFESLFAAANQSSLSPPLSSPASSPDHPGHSNGVGNDAAFLPPSSIVDFNSLVAQATFDLKKIPGSGTAVLDLSVGTASSKSPTSSVSGKVTPMNMLQNDQNAINLLIQQATAATATNGGTIEQGQLGALPPGSTQTVDFCPYCKKSFCNKYYLRKHLRDIHRLDVARPPRGQALDLVCAAPTSSFDAAATAAQQPQVSPPLPQARLSSNSTHHQSPPANSLAAALQQFLSPPPETQTKQQHQTTSSSNNASMLPWMEVASAAAAAAAAAASMPAQQSKSEPVKLSGMEAFLQNMMNPPVSAAAPSSSNKLDSTLLNINQQLAQAFQAFQQSSSSSSSASPGAAFSKPQPPLNAVTTSNNQTNGSSSANNLLRELAAAAGLNLSQLETPMKSLQHQDSADQNLTKRLLNQQALEAAAKLMASQTTSSSKQSNGQLAMATPQHSLTAQNSSSLILNNGKTVNGAANQSSSSTNSSNNVQSAGSGGGGGGSSSSITERVECDICHKLVCNKYFLRAHKFKIHHIRDPRLPPKWARIAAEMDKQQLQAGQNPLHFQQQQAAKQQAQQQQQQQQQQRNQVLEPGEVAGEHQQMAFDDNFSNDMPQIEVLKEQCNGDELMDVNKVERGSTTSGDTHRRRSSSLLAMAMKSMHKRSQMANSAQAKLLAAASNKAILLAKARHLAKFMNRSRLTSLSNRSSDDNSSSSYQEFFVEGLNSSCSDDVSDKEHQQKTELANLALPIMSLRLPVCDYITAPLTVRLRLVPKPPSLSYYSTNSNNNNNNNDINLMAAQYEGKMPEEVHHSDSDIVDMQI